MGGKKRVWQGVGWGIADSVLVAAVITILFQCLASPLSAVFGMASGSSSDDVQQLCVTAMHIATIGYIFMGFSVAVQGVLQAFGYGMKPLIISFLRLVFFVFPIAYLFIISADAVNTVWWTFPIAEALTAVVSAVFLLLAKREKMDAMEEHCT